MKNKNFKSINAVFCENVIKKMALSGMSMKTLSYKTDITYETLKRLLTGTTLNPSLYLCLKIARALDSSLSELLNSSMEDFQEYNLLTESSKKLIRIMALCEYSAYNAQKNDDEKFFIPLFKADQKENNTQLLWKLNSFNESKIYISRKRYKNCAFAIEIPDNRLHPVYFQKDIIIITQCPHIASTNTVVFSYEDTINIAKYSDNDQNPFSSVNGLKREFYNIDIKNITILGYVYDVLRCTYKNI